MGRTLTFEWFSRFKCGETSVEDSERSGRPSTGRTDEILENVVPPGQTVNQHYYLEILKRLREQARRKRPNGGGTRTGCADAHCFVCAAIFGR